MKIAGKENTIPSISLGTAQFGFDYGVNNSTGEIGQQEIENILLLAFKNNINSIDTAYSYGKSENKLGDALSKLGIDFQITTKLPNCSPDEVSGCLKESLMRLNRNKLHACLIHDFENFKKCPDIWTELIKLKQIGLIDKPGFSLYHPEEYEYLIENGIQPDIIQIPFNIFDRRFSDYFEKIKRNNTEIHTRSVFLQGLFFSDVEFLQKHFPGYMKYFVQLRKIKDNYKIEMFDLCLHFVMSFKEIDYMVVGFDSFVHFSQLMKSYKDYKYNSDLFELLIKLRIDDENFILPSKWRLK